MALSPAHTDKLPGHPFFRRYGVNLPSSLTEGRSFTWGEFPLPTSVGVRYGQQGIWLAAFLGDLGAARFRLIAQARASRHALLRGGFASRARFVLAAGPVHLTGRVSLSRSRFTLLTMPAGAGVSHLLAIAYG